MTELLHSLVSYRTPRGRELDGSRYCAAIVTHVHEDGKVALTLFPKQKHQQFRDFVPPVGDNPDLEGFLFDGETDRGGAVLSLAGLCEKLSGQVEQLQGRVAELEMKRPKKGAT